MQIFPICMDCKHFIVSEKTFNKCRAFPAPPGIPWEIVSDRNPHEEIIPGQTGNFVFTEKK